MTLHDPDRVFRIGVLARMFSAYGIVPDEDRLTAYLGVLAPIPSDRVAEAVKAGMAESDGSYPPGPGQIVAAWKALREARPEERPYRPAEDGPRNVQVSAGAVMDQLAARVEPGAERDILALARELRRTHAKHFPPHPAESRTPSLVAAAMKLGMRWPMQPDHVAQVSGWMAEAADGAWWASEKRRTATEGSGSV